MPWTAAWPITTGDGYNNTLYADNLDEAREERMHVINPPFIPLPSGHHHTQGDDMQTMGNFLFDNVVWTWQQMATALANQFVNTTIDFAGDNAPLDPLGSWYWSIVAIWAAAGVDPAGWHAEYPREIFDVSAPTYLDFDTPVDGEFALHSLEGRIYERVAGAWVLRGNVGVWQATVKTTHRNGLSGDFLNKTTFNEIYYVYDLERWRLGEFASALSCTVDDGHWLIASDSASNLSWPASQADAQTNYIGSLPGNHGAGPDDGPGVFHDFAIYTAGDQDNNGFYLSEMSCSRYRLRVDPDAALIFAFESDYYSRVTAVPADTLVTIPAPVFDANGADVVEDKWHRWDTSGPSSIAQVSIYVGQDRATYTPNWCAIPSYPVDEGRGFRTQWLTGFIPGSVAAGMGMVLRFDVVGGFNMVS